MRILATSVTCLVLVGYAGRREAGGRASTPVRGASTSNGAHGEARPAGVSVRARARLPTCAAPTRRTSAGPTATPARAATRREDPAARGRAPETPSCGWTDGTPSAPAIACLVRTRTRPVREERTG